MATELDTEFRAMALETIAEVGKPVSWTSRTQDSSDYSPSTGVGSPTETAYTVTVTPPQEFDPASMRTSKQFAPSNVSISGELYVMVAASGLQFVPASGDFVEIDSEVWSVVGVQRVYSGELVCAYSARVVRS